MLMIFASVVTYVAVIWIGWQHITKKPLPTEEEMLAAEGISLKDLEREAIKEQKTVTVMPGLDKDINIRPEPNVVAITPQEIGSSYEGQKEMW